MCSSQGICYILFQASSLHAQAQNNSVYGTGVSTLVTIGRAAQELCSLCGPHSYYVLGSLFDT